MSGQVVVDASLAVKWILIEDDTREAMYLLRRWQADGIDRIVPSWFGCEVANVLYQEIRANRLELARAQAGILTLLNEMLVLDVEPFIATRAIELATLHRQRATYDAQYLALAEHLDCELWTADERFWNSTKAAFPRVHWLGEIVIPEPSEETAAE